MQTVCRAGYFLTSGWVFYAAAYDSQVMYDFSSSHVILIV
jgi:hypothetical protein